MSDADTADLWDASTQAKAPGAAPLWQVNTRGRKVLEMTDAELLASLKAGKLTARSLVWVEGMPEWAPLGDVPKLAKLIRADSEPPASGARPIEDDVEPTTKRFTNAPSEPPDPGPLAVYERPLATIEFPDADAAEPADEPTPAVGLPPKALSSTPQVKLPPRSAVPAVTPAAGRPAPAATPATSTPSVPAIPARSYAFPTPVLASPLGAALSATVAPTPPPPVAMSLASVRKTLPGVTAEELGLSSNVEISGGTPPSVPVHLGPASQSSAPPPPPALPVVAKPVTSSPPRPAIEFLPPVIVQEKDDDGTSLLELPLGMPLEMPLDATFHESTLVLAGRRPKRWVSLNAAVAAAIGTACLGASLTLLVVRTRPEPPPRIVEKRVLVPVPAPPPEAPAPPSTVAAQSAPAAPRVEATEKSAPERSASKSEGASSKRSSNDSWRREDADPGSLSGAEPAPARRAGFPTNPGF